MTRLFSTLSRYLRLPQGGRSKKGAGQIKRATPVLAALALMLSGEGPAKAGVLSPHGQSVIQSYTVGPDYLFNQTVDGDTTFLQNSAATNSAGTSSAISHTVPNYSQFVGGQATSTSPGSNAAFDTDSTAAWRDVLHLGGPGSLPAAVTFHFQVEGTLIATTDRNASIAEFAAWVAPPSTSGFTLSRFGGYGLKTNLALEPSFSGPMSSPNGWDALQITGSNFVGTFSYTASYDPTLRGYGFELLEAGITEVNGGNATGFVQFNDPLTADFVTNTDGTPLSGFTLSFDSGLSPSAVPEPSSLTLLGTGFAGLFGYLGWRRRK